MVVRGPIPEEKTRQTPRAEGGEGARSAAPEARPSLTGGSEVCRWRVPGFGLLPWTALSPGRGLAGVGSLEAEVAGNARTRASPPGSRGGGPGSRSRGYHKSLAPGEQSAVQRRHALLGSKREQIIPEGLLHLPVCRLPCRSTWCR